MKYKNWILLLVLLGGSELLADQESFLSEKPELLAWAERSPLVKAELFKKHKMYAEAEEIFTTIINSAVPPDNGSVESNISVQVDCEKTLSLDYIYYSRADCWYYLKLFDKALTDYQESYRLDNDPTILRVIAQCMYEEGMYDEAIKNYDEYLARANPDRTGQYLARYYKALCILNKGELRAGGLYLLELQEDFPERKESIQKTLRDVMKIAEGKGGNGSSCQGKPGVSGLEE
jgi:tetratricopeptide (TPR) repeat protein